MTAQTLELIAAPENLLSAWRSVRGNIPKYRRERAKGPDGVSLAEFEQDLNAQLKVLRDMLIKGRYEPAAPAYFSVPKRNGGQRMLAILPVRDRVAQRATQQVLEPMWEPDFLPCSFGFRPGISLEQAVIHVQDLRRHEYGWVVDGDIAACFDSLDHELLIHRVQHKIKDGRVLKLMQAWLDAGVMQAGPPQTVDMQQATRIEAAKGYVKKGFGWMADAVFHRISPYGGYNSLYEESAYSDSEPAMPTSPRPMNDSYMNAMERNALGQVLLSGFLMSMGVWRRRAANWLPKAGAALKTAAATPAGRRLLKKSALATGGFAGVAAAAAVTAYVLNRRAGPSPAGVLQGSPLSPLLANIYMHPFDVTITSAGHELARFADDWVILCPTQDKAETAYNDAIRALAKLHLKANLEKTHILSPGQKLEWLGAVIP